MSSTPAPYKPPTAEEMDGISRPPPETTQQMHDDVAAHSKVHNHKGAIERRAWGFDPCELAKEGLEL